MQLLVDRRKAKRQRRVTPKKLKGRENMSLGGLKSEDRGALTCS
jgi:hypothetical protein